MEKIRELLYRVFRGERRKEQVPVTQERRKVRMRMADDRLKAALHDLDQTVRISREQFFKREVANDRQQVVTFSSYREICEFKGPEMGSVRLCRNSMHPDASNSALAICDEYKCPKMNAALVAA